MVGMRRNRWLIITIVALVAVLLGATGALIWQHVRPRLPTLATATPTLDQAIALVITAAGGNAAVAVSGLVPSTSCQKTFVAKGSRYTRTADLYTNPGQENTIIDSVAAALPAAEHPVRNSRGPGGGESLTADLGGGIHLQVLAIGEGWLAATAVTDCRTGGATQPTAVTDPAADTAAVTKLLTELGTAPASFHVDVVACPSGRIVTLDAISQPTRTDKLFDRLVAFLPAGARQFSSTSNRLAWRDQNVSTIVASSDDGTQIAIQRTTSC
jgi:hypothetical protein